MTLACYGIFSELIFNSPLHPSKSSAMECIVIKESELLLPVRRQQSLHPLFCIGVELHEDHIEDIDEEEQQGLPPHDEVVNEEEDESDEGDTVESTVSEQWPPGEVENCFAEQGAHPNDKEDVEHSRPHYRPDADV